MRHIRHTLLWIFPQYEKALCCLIISINKPPGGACVISYDPLFKTMKDRAFTQSDLLDKDKAGFDNHTFFDIRQGKSVTLKTIESLCRILGCSIQDVVEIIPDDDWEPYVPDKSRKKDKKTSNFY